MSILLGDVITLGGGGGGGGNSNEVIISDTQPTETDNKLWVKESSSSDGISIPTMGDVSVIENTLNSKADAPIALSLTLAAGSWTSATPPTQTLTATGVTATSNIIVGLAGTATSSQFDEAAAAKLVCTAQGTDSITVTAYGTTPTGNIPISVVILG